MLGDLRRLIAARPFVPFTIFTGEDESVRIATIDHVAISPTSVCVVAFAAADSVIHISPRQVARIIVDPPPAKAEAA